MTGVLLGNGFRNPLDIPKQIAEAYNKLDPREGLPMPDFNFDDIEIVGNDQFPKRGRKAMPLPEGLLNALRQTMIQNASATITVDTDEHTKFLSVLVRCAKHLNMRLEKDSKHLGTGKTRVTFRGRGIPNKEVKV